MNPKIIKGDVFKDDRGTVNFNNDFNASGIKRVYTIENNSKDFIRCWQGHKVEQRWFSAIFGSFKIRLIKIDNWDQPTKNLPVLEFILKSETLDVLHVPRGFVSSIQALDSHSKLLLFADHHLSEVQDDYRFPAAYFI